jgi:hypothetical protein
MASVVVGLLGKKQSGKDTLAAALVNNHDWKRFAFADLLRQVLYGIDPLVRVEQDELGLLPADWCLPHLAGHAYHRHLKVLVDAIGWDQAKKIREVRRLLQRTGTEGVRSVDDDFWWRETMKLIDAEPGPVVITDCRFPNECIQARQRGLLVRINRPGTDETDQHASETAWLDQEVDFVFENEGTLLDLEDWVDGFAAGIADGTYDAILERNRQELVLTVRDGAPWTRPYAPVGVFDEDDFEVIRQQHRDALQRWHNKD